MPKREHGSGTWKKRTNGTWELQLSFGRDLDGKLVRKSFYGKTKRICQEKADEYKLRLSNNEIATKEMRLGTWMSKWLETYKANSVSEGTYENYLYHRDIILRHKISNMKLTEIKSIHVTEFINDNQEYSMSALKKLKLLLGGAFEDAIENELCQHNPVRKVKLPQKEKVERDFFNDNELDAIYEFAKTDPFGHVMQVLLRTGIRSGELRALRWDDFDFENRLLTVNKAIKINGDIGTTKSGRDRTVPITNELNDFLRGLDRTGTYLTNTDEPLGKDPFKNKYNAFFDRLKRTHPEVRHLSPHCCRHTYATILHKKRMPLKYIQILLGHSDIQTTGNVYTHVDLEEIRKAVDLI